MSGIVYLPTETWISLTYPDSIYIVTYGLGFYFTVINWGISQRFVKRAFHTPFQLALLTLRVV